MSRDRHASLAMTWGACDDVERLPRRRVPRNDMMEVDTCDDVERLPRRRAPRNDNGACDDMEN